MASIFSIAARHCARQSADGVLVFPHGMLETLMSIPTRLFTATSYYANRIGDIVFASPGRTPEILTASLAALRMNGSTALVSRQTSKCDSPVSARVLQGLKDNKIV